MPSPGYISNSFFYVISVDPALRSPGPLIGIRHLQALLLFLAIVVNYTARLSVSVAVVAITDAATTNPDFPVSPLRLTYASHK